MTVCSTLNIRETQRYKINTGCCWNKFSEFKSLESSDSEQRDKGGLGDPGRTRRTTGKREEAPVLTVHHIILSSHKFARQPVTMFLNVTHHEVLDCIAAAAFKKLHLGDACGTDCGAAASFIIIISLFTLVFFGLLCYVMLATSSSLSLTPLTYLAGRL